jgi:hypothetical protein
LKEGNDETPWPDLSHASHVHDRCNGNSMRGKRTWPGEFSRCAGRVFRPFAGNPVPSWRNGFFAGFELEPAYAPAVNELDSDGRKIFGGPLKIDGAARIVTQVGVRGPNPTTTW